MCVGEVCKGLDEDLGNYCLVNFSGVKLVEFKDGKIGLKVICVVINLMLSVKSRK